MSKYKYSAKAEENCAKAVGVALPISTKQSIEICKYIRGRTIERAKRILQEAADLKKAIPLTRFNNDVGHKKGMGSGRYMVKSVTEIKSLIESAEANAQFKGLSTSSLIIKHISAQQAPGAWHYGRQRRRKMKRTHIELILEEQKEEKKK